MPKPSIYFPEDLLADLDDQIEQDKRDGNIPFKWSRSKVIQELIRSYVEGNFDCPLTEQTAENTAMM